MGVTGIGTKGWAAVQDGAKEQLLCEGCEQHFNKHYEIPFKIFWVDNPKLPDPWLDNAPRCINTEYRTFKLFHLSVLFRAGACTLPMFSNVNLGPHKDRIRKMLLDGDPGKDHEYPIGGCAVLHHENRDVIKIISQSQNFRFGGKPCYSIMYGGVDWWFSVSSDRNPEFEQFSLKSNGKICLSAFSWNEFGAVQKASLALQHGARSNPTFKRTASPPLN